MNGSLCVDSYCQPVGGDQLAGLYQVEDFYIVAFSREKFYNPDPAI